MSNSLVRPIVGYLLHVANSRPPHMRRQEFYAMKDYLCRRYGRFVEIHWQEIARECYGCDGTGVHDSGHDCRRCGGSGVYQRFWSELELWQIGKWRFHRPKGRRYSKPDAPIKIHGLVEHRHDYGRGSDEAALWLALFYDRRLFRDLMTGTCSHGRYLWPLKLAQRVAMPAAMFLGRFRRRRCWQCGRNWRTWFASAGWQVCGRCRAHRDEALAVADDDEIPF